ncbi:LOW QUALITY PROTEIN: UPF0503 protein At3g09070, chloroplastic-like [Phalaenopsis equestris]|uniref:LOW QUALITY PROTEIN: UPF0503 protein At3g09070, chloroplastic-like n=1 Tax=Phalaenopsis equestris TaxID=78828 RepID=UPI0009E1FA01|nr:LOW QUALITY PROTEIN: UPF0503 protein At3g09070, chloroplastic-like [Phalaenopsis equestris]
METEPHRPQQQGMSSHCLLSNCKRHPDEQVTGFCASCLRERLAGLDNDNARRTSTSSAAASLKTIFLSSSIGVNGRASSSSQRRSCHNKNTAASSVRPDLRRCKSFAGGPRSDAAVEPRRKSCDVRVRSTLSSLFHLDDRDRILDGRQKFLLSSSTAAATALAAGEIEVEADSVVIVDASKDELEDVKPMKDHIDLDSSHIKKDPAREVKEIAGSFWLAASIFSKKLQKWRRKQKTNRSTAQHGGIRTSLALPSEKEKKPISSRPFRDTQSEIAVDSIARRRSCDIAPRYSLEAGRISFDERRCSLEDPRASWDGCLFNSGRSLHSRFPVKLAVVEDAVERSDGLIPVEEDTKTPGCSAQTRDYYSDFSSRRRRSLDRSSSSRRHSVVLCDSKRTPNASIPELFHWSKLERESNSFREDGSGNFVSTFRDPVNIPSVKKSRHWSIWGFIHRRNANRPGESQSMDRTFSETWPELRVTGTTMQRSSSVSARRSFSTNGRLSSTQKSVKKKNKNSKEIVLDKSQSARYSPSHFDNGLLRFYLTPSRGNWRNGMLAKNKFGSPRSFTSNILRLY